MTRRPDESTPGPPPSSDGGAGRSAELDALRDENRQLRKALAEQRSLVANLLEFVDGAARDSLHAAPPGATEPELAELHDRLSNLASLYIASLRLHEAFRRGDVLAALEEIVANLIGCEQMAFFETDPAGALRVAHTVGVSAERCAQLAGSDGPLSSAFARGTPWFAPRDGGPDDLTACVPLRLGGSVRGLIALFELLPQKRRGLEERDEKLLELLSEHAGCALCCNRGGGVRCLGGDGAPG